MPHPTRARFKFSTNGKAFLIEFSSFSGTDVSQMSVGFPGGGVVETSNWSVHLQLIRDSTQEIICLYSFVLGCALWFDDE